MNELLKFSRKLQVSSTTKQQQQHTHTHTYTPSLKVGFGFCFGFFKIYLFIYFWLRWAFIAARRLSLVAASGGYSSLRCTGFSLRWLLLLWSTSSRLAGSVVVALRLSSCGSRALEHRLSSCGART